MVETRPKILILTSNHARHDHFCITLTQALGDTCAISIIQEPKAARPVRSRTERFWLSKNKVQMITNFFVNAWYRNATAEFQSEEALTEQRFFSEDSRSFDTVCGNRVVAHVARGQSINDRYYVDQIKALAPDMIVVMGTSLIRKDIIAIPRLGIINLHTGLSPYYRGGLTNLWPILNREPQFCGVTIHKMSTGVDSGDIIYNGLPVIEESDTFSSINCKAIILGTGLMVQAVKDLLNGGIRAKPQWIAGQVYAQRDINGRHFANYLQLLASGYLREYADRARAGAVAYPEGLMLSLDSSLPQIVPAHGIRS